MIRRLVYAILILMAFVVGIAVLAELMRWVYGL